MKPDIRPYEQGRISDAPNRADQIRRDDDTVKVPKITLYDIDYAIHYHIAEVIRPRIRENGGISVPVPVYFANAEKWAQIRSQGFMRDATNKAIAPAIVLRRSTVTSDDRLPIVDTNLFNPQTFNPKLKLYPMRRSGMKWDRLAGQYQRNESTEYYLVDMPDYVRVTYDVVLWTDLIEQMNDLVHPIMNASNHVWGDYFKFRTAVLDVSHDNTNIPGEDRIIKSTMQLQVDGYLRSEYEYQQSKIAKQYSIKTVKFLAEGSEQIIQDDLTGVDTNRPGMGRTPADVPSSDSKRNLRF